MYSNLIFAAALLAGQYAAASPAPYEHHGSPLPTPSQGYHHPIGHNSTTGVSPSGSGVARPTGTGSPMPGGKGLHDIACGHGLQYFGAAVGRAGLRDAEYVKILSDKSEFGLIVAENAMKWSYVEPRFDEFTFGEADKVVELARKNGQHMHCHALVWHNSLPDWVEYGKFDRDALIIVMQNHIKKTVTHFKGVCKHWDVVNEALLEDGSFRKSIFFNTIGEEYIPIAFQAAHEADPDAKLYYNDFTTDRPSPKTKAVRELVKMIRAYGAPIHGIGRQAHLGTRAPSEEEQKSVMDSWADLEIDIAITELDISIKLPVTPEKEAEQVKAYARTAAACVKHDKCIGINLWGYSDRYSWIPYFDPTLGSACPWDKNLKRKPAYFGLAKGLTGQS